MPKIRYSLVAWIILSLLLATLSPGPGLARPLRASWSPGAPPADAPTATTVSVNPLNPSVSGCNTVDVYIDVNSVTNLYGLDVRLSFDPAVIEVVDFDPLSAVVEIEPIIDPVLQFKAGFTVRNVVDNINGTIWYAATQISPTPVVNGSGHIARLRLRAKSNAAAAMNFTYIKLSNPVGDSIPATGTNGTVTVTGAVAPTSLAISRLNTNQVRLSWLSAAGVAQYKVYRSSTPYFNPYAVPVYATQAPVGSPGSTQTFDDSVLGNVNTNYFYTLRAECTTPASSLSAAAWQVGKFEYRLYETADTDYSWVALPLVVPGLSTASALANHIQNNSSAAVSVLTVGRWNALSQGIENYDHTFLFGDFAVANKFPYRVEIDLPSLSIGSVIWALTGPLPLITSDTYTLSETADTDYTWVMQPLDLTTVATADVLATHIQNNASAPVAVLTVSRWNAVAQSIEQYDHAFGFGNFDTRFGYPYQVEVNVNSGTSVTWP